MTEPTCIICQGPIPENRKNYRGVKMCSNACRKERARLEYLSRRPRIPLTAPTTGAIGELLVAADLLAKGYAVFRALSPSCPCDLTFLHYGKLYRVEVRTGTRGKDKNTWYASRKSDNGKHDIMAIRLRDPEEIIYKPDLPINPAETS